MNSVIEYAQKHGDLPPPASFDEAFNNGYLHEWDRTMRERSLLKMLERAKEQYKNHVGFLTEEIESLSTIRSAMQVSIEEIDKELTEFELSQS